jgi:hypothetical protein
LTHLIVNREFVIVTTAQLFKVAYGKFAAGQLDAVRASVKK